MNPMDSVMDAMILEQEHHDYTNYTTVEKIDQMYIMMKVTTCMIAIFVALLFVIAFSLMIVIYGQAKESAEDEIEKDKEKVKERKNRAKHIP